MFGRTYFNQASLDAISFVAMSGDKALVAMDSDGNVWGQSVDQMVLIDVAANLRSRGFSVATLYAREFAYIHVVV